MTQILFDTGTAYDFFVSLIVLHDPDSFGLRSQWAAGVRSRLPLPQRNILEQAALVLPMPLFWLATMESFPRDSAAVLAALQTLPAAQPDTDPERSRILHAVAAGHKPSQAELDILKKSHHKGIHSRINERLSATLVAWSHATEFGERLLDGLVAYRSAFFAEEEERIRPSLTAGDERARALAAKLPLEQLVEDLTQGVRIEALQSTTQLVLAPSFWSSPLIFYGIDPPRKSVLVYGCRSANQGLIPGEQVPAALVNGLKALGDPTRLKILHYLADAPLTPAELSRRLRLRPPTIIHHLQALRLAGLVQISLTAAGERRYSLRRDAPANLLVSLQDFLGQPIGQEPD